MPRCCTDSIVKMKDPKGRYQTRPYCGLKIYWRRINLTDQPEKVHYVKKKANASGTRKEVDEYAHCIVGRLMRHCPYITYASDNGVNKKYWYSLLEGETK